MSGLSRFGKSRSSRALSGIIVAVLLVWGSLARAEHKLKDQDCLGCHSDSTLTKDVNGKPVSIAVDGTKLKHSIHGSMFACVDCHKDVTSLVHETPPKKVACAQCHADAQEAYSHSLHAKPANAKNTQAANCQDCHGGAHEILAADDPKSPVNHSNIPTTCGRCHGQKFLMESNGESNQAFLSYQESVHGRAVENGSQKAAVCTDCHGAHEFCPRAIPNRRSTRQAFLPPAASATRRLKTHSIRAFTGRRLRVAINWLRCARTATGFTPSNRQ